MLTCRWLRALPILVLAWLTLAASNARAQTISVPALSNVGSGLQGAANTATLSTSQHGGKTVHVESDNPSVVLVAPNTTTAGAASFDVFVPNGSTSVSFVIQGMEDTTGTATVTVSAPGFTSGSRTATIVQPALAIINLITSLDTLDPADPFWVQIGLPSGGNGFVNPTQSVRVGGTGLTATIVNSNAVAGQLITTPVTGQTVTVSIPPGLYFSPTTVAAGGVAFDGLDVASTTVSASIPGFIATTAATVTVSVTQPTISLNAIGNTGSGLQGLANGVTLSASEHGGVTVHVESGNPSVALVSPNGTTAGTASIDVFVANGATGASFVVSGLEGATGVSLITVSAPGFGSASQTASIQQPALAISSLVTTLDTLDPADPFWVQIGLPSGGNTSVNPTQSIRAGGVPVTATIKNSATAIGDLITTPLTGDSVTVTIPVGSYFSPVSVATGGVAFDGTALGSTLVFAAIPGFIPTTASVQTVNVTQPGISLNPLGTVGSGLQGLGNSATLSASQHGGVTVHVESANPSAALVAPTPTTVGSASFDVFLANGSTSVAFYVSGMENVTGTSLITVSAPGFTSVSQTATIVQPAFDVVALGTTIDTLNPADPFQVRVGLPSGSAVNPAQSVRAGGTALTATVKNSNHPVGDLITTPLTGDSVVVSITPGNSSSPGTVATGGVAFDGTQLGSTVVSATIPGLIATTAASQTVNVTQPSISLNGLGTVGSGLQGPVNSATLSASQHGGVTVHVASANPSVALVAPNATTAGSASFDVFLANGSASVTLCVSGMENVTGTSLVTVSAPGFISVSQTATIATPALDMIGLTSAMDATDPNDPFQVRVGLPAGGNGSVNPAQVVRAGSPGLTATITLTNAVAGQLVTTLATNDTVTVNIAAGASVSGATVLAGGVAFDPLAPGTTLVAATIPGFIPTGAATQQVVVSQRIVTMGTIEDVGAGLQSGAIGAVLGLAQHGGVTVHVASSDPSVALLAPNFSTPGTASLDFPLSNGSTQVSFYVQGIAIGTADITASVPTFTAAVRVASIVQPALQVALLPDSIMDDDPNDPFVVRVGVPNGDQSTVGVPQFVRAGGPTLTATVSSSDATIAALVTNAENGSPVVVTIAAGETQSGASAVLGGVELDPLLPGATTISAVIPDFISTAAASHVVTVHALPTGAGAVPLVSGLAQNIPNPFNPITTIRYDVTVGGADVSIVVFDVAGRVVRTLVNEHRGPGAGSVQWNGDDDHGQRVASGVYFYRMRAGSFVDTKKMVLLK